MGKLKPYMVYFKDCQAEEAVLVFHFTAKLARVIGWGWLESGGHFVDVRANLLKEEYMLKHADQLKLKKSKPHAVNPPVCDNCEMWGGEPLGDGCTLCQWEEE